MTQNTGDRPTAKVSDHSDGTQYTRWIRLDLDRCSKSAYIL